MLKEYLDRDFDIFHFWNKSLFFDNQYRNLTGFDIPLIKARRKHIAYRFTGFDVRLPSWDLKQNPYSPFRYGYRHLFDENIQMKYLDFLSEHVDQFIVQDPEIGQYSPRQPVTIPRALKLSEWPEIGVQRSDRPLIVHAPTNDECKGSRFVLKAVETLEEEGLSFDFKAIRGLSHREAVDWYKRSDIVVDQLLIGATGVTTLEAMALGKPCVVYLREDLFKPFYKTNDLPVANANPDTITDVLRELIKDFEWRNDLSKRGRRLVNEFHDIDIVVDQYIDTYNSIIDREPFIPSGTRDIEYLAASAEYTQRLEFLSTGLGGSNALGKTIDQFAASPSVFFSRLDGDEKLRILDALLPRIVVTPIRTSVKVRRGLFAFGRKLATLGRKIRSRLIWLRMR